MALLLAQHIEQRPAGDQIVVFEAETTEPALICYNNLVDVCSAVYNRYMIGGG
jgi:hypothetical protein